jgi:hypothetical protein
MDRGGKTGGTPSDAGALHRRPLAAQGEDDPIPNSSDQALQEWDCLWD